MLYILYKKIEIIREVFYKKIHYFNKKFKYLKNFIMFLLESNFYKV